MSPNQKPAIGAKPRISWDLVVLLASLMWLFREWVAIPIRISGESMMPTCRNGMIAVINRLAYLFSPPQRGDVVLVKGTEDLMIKRVVGLPGENVALIDGIISVNGRLLSEKYVQLKNDERIKAGALGRENYLIIGDNRSGTALAVVNRRRILGALMHSPTRVTDTPAAAPKEKGANPSLGR